MPVHSKTENRKPAPMRRTAPEKEGADVVPFPGHSRRPVRLAPSSDEAKGKILLFVGVRYERLAS